MGIGLWIFRRMFGMKIVVLTLVMMVLQQETSAFKSKRGTACEGSSLTLSCNVGESMTVSYAQYGRSTPAICPGTGSTQTCYNPSSVYIMRARLLSGAGCNGQQSCTVAATNSVFGVPPCGNVYKYLDVYYLCLCNATPAAVNCCTSTNKCGVGEGDCDFNSDCQPGLSCGSNNCRQFHPAAPSWADCCWDPNTSNFGKSVSGTDNSGEPSGNTTYPVKG